MDVISLGPRAKGGGRAGADARTPTMIEGE